MFVWVELIGYCGTALTVVAYAMRTSIRLRVAGILSSVAFLAYGYLTESYPVMLMEMILLPLNVLRLVEMLRLVRRVPGCDGKEAMPAAWLAPHMHRRNLHRGEALFSRGDPADRLVLLVCGTLRNPETGDVLRSGVLVGDALPFLPEGRQSVTLVAAGDAVVGELRQERLRELCFQNPAFGHRLAELVLGSMRHEIQRLRDQKAATRFTAGEPLKRGLAPGSVST